LPKIRSAIFGFIALALVGCASPEIIQEKQLSDSSLSCSGLSAAIEEARAFEIKARAERGVTGTNAAAVVFFWPALLATYSNTESAITAAQSRQSLLLKQYEAKKCDTDNLKSTQTSPLEQNLLELKSLFERGLLSEDEYAAARKKMLGL